jgi:Flp pilus assembly protein TadD
MRRFTLLLLLLCFLSNVAVTRSQVNRRVAIEHLNRGTKELDAGDLDGAISDFGKTIELNPQNAQAHANRGIILLLRGRDATAQQEFETALKMDSTLNPGLQNLINQILGVRKSKP